MKKQKEQAKMLEMGFLGIYQARMVKKGVLGGGCGETTPAYGHPSLIKAGNAGAREIAAMSLRSILQITNLLT